LFGGVFISGLSYFPVLSNGQLDDHSSSRCEGDDSYLMLKSIWQWEGAEILFSFRHDCLTVGSD
jgi:hypothetical protein